MGVVVIDEFEIAGDISRTTITRQSDGKEAVIFGEDVGQFWEMVTGLQKKHYSPAPYVRRVFFAARGE